MPVSKLEKNVYIEVLRYKKNRKLTNDAILLTKIRILLKSYTDVHCLFLFKKAISTREMKNRLNNQYICSMKAYVTTRGVGGISGKGKKCQN